MTDEQMYLSGWLNPDEQAQWEYVTQMMADADHAAALESRRYEADAWEYEQDRIEARGPKPKFHCDDEIPF